MFDRIARTRWLPFWLFPLWVSTAWAGDVYVSINATPTAPYAAWSTGFTNLQQALDYVSEGDTIYLAGHTFVGDALANETVFVWSNAHGVVIRGGYAATNDVHLPGARDSEQWPTVLSRASGSARVLTMVNVSNCLFEQLTFRDGHIDNRFVQSARYGGGIYLSGCRDIVFDDCLIVSNIVQSGREPHGGGLYLHNSDLTLNRCRVADNEGIMTPSTWWHPSYGGGVFIDGLSRLTTSNTVFEANAIRGGSHGRGGAVHVAAGGELIARETVFVANEARSGGSIASYGGAIANYGTARLRNALVVNNETESRHSDGILSAGAAALTVLDFCTVAHNHHGIGIRRDGGTIAVSNSIVWGHDVADLIGFTVDNEGVLPDLWYSNTGEGWNAGKQGCHTIDPLFADRVTYHLQSSAGHYTNGYFSGGYWTVAAANSPVIDRADPTAAYEREPDPNGGRANMGAYGNTPVAARTPTIVADPPGVVNHGAWAWGHRTVRVRGEVTDTGGDTPEVFCQYWETGGVATSTVSAGLRNGVFEQTLVGLTPGVAYEYRIKASNIAGDPYSATDGFAMHPVNSYLYVATNGNHTAGASWSTAYTNLDTAWRIAEPGDTIYVAGQVFTAGPYVERDPTYGGARPYDAAFVWRNATNIILRGGYAAAGDGDLPGPRDSRQWPTVLSPATDNLRVLTMVNAANCLIEQVTLRDADHYSPVQTTSRYGGGLYLFRCRDIVLEGCLIVSNTVGGSYPRAGGLYLENSDLTLYACLVADNRSLGNTTWHNYPSYAGGAYVDGNSHLKLGNTIVRNNHVRGSGQPGHGGGVYVEANGELSVHATVMIGNRASSGDGSGPGRGGAIAALGMTRMRNTLVIGNEAADGHSDGILSSGAAALTVLENCTVAHNHDEIGIRRDGAGTIALTNTIVWGHTEDLKDFPVDGDGHLVDVSHSLFAVPDSMHGIQGCLSVDPVFLDSAAGNYRLGRDSPAIDAGLNLPWMPGAFDLDGYPRMIPGEPFGAPRVDMGAHEALLRGTFIKF